MGRAREDVSPAGNQRPARSAGRARGLRMTEQVYAHLNAADGYEAVTKILIADR